MSSQPEPRVRRSLADLQKDYENGNKKPLEDLIRAWRGIQKLPPTDPRSFFMLGGYHGEPFRGAGWGNASYWGGYCHHGNILFPTWHRAYLYKIEKALQSIPGCEDVMMPFWDECSQESRDNGIPWALTVETFELDGATIANPLVSYTLPRNIVDHIPLDPTVQPEDYSKPAGYGTVRYPLSGLVGNADAAATAAHNAQFPDYQQNVRYLNQNVTNWLGASIIIGGKPINTNVYGKFIKCLDAPNYTVFSNTSSRDEYNANATVKAQALESPHNSIHLAIGGFDVPGTGPASGQLSPISGANGDMGENDTAALDPIFFFHHCFIDYVFWIWQQRQGATGKIEVIAGYPGTNSVDSQGPTPGVAPNSWLTLETPLEPFTRGEDGSGGYFTSLDCVNIAQLGYSYGPGSLDSYRTKPAQALVGDLVEAAEKKVHVTGVNRGAIRGSFLISAFVNVDGKKQHIGSEAVLSRWHVEGCANCQKHLQASATFTLRGAALTAAASPDAVEVEVLTRDGLLGGEARGPAAVASVDIAETRPHFRVEVR